MAWPTGGDYSEAVQNPRVAFRDSELVAGTVELTRLGMPKPRAGSFAVAFKMQCAGRDEAVRCFLREAADRQERYRLISEFLTEAKLQYTVGFDYQAQGVLARGAWRPILKMEWVHGSTLGEYVRSNVGSAQVLIELAGRWVEMTRALDAAGMAHGDLQHGNVMVMPAGQIKLIDYDGMFVPKLAGHPSEELGHRNYQHPLRTALDFGPYLDHFSEWVIYVSLVLLSLDPTLWTKLQGGDECLLFRRADFDPNTSPALGLLDNAPDERVRALAQAFRTLLYFGVTQVPLIDSSSLPTNVPTAVPAPPAPLGAPAGADWLRDHIGVGADASGVAAAQTAAAPTTSPRMDASWILSLTGPAPAAARFTNRTTFEWLTFVVSAVIAVLVLHYFTPDAAPVIALLSFVNLSTWLVRYHKQELVQKASVASKQVAEQRQKVAATEAQLADLERQRSGAARLLQQRLAAVAAARLKIQQAEIRDGEKPRAQLKLTVGSINDVRKKLADGDSRELRKLQQGLGGQLMNAQRDLASVDQGQLAELSQALEALRNEYVRQRMETAALGLARVPGIGPGRVRTLQAAGVVTAADMKRRGLYGIPGIGPALQSSLLAWARDVEASAMGSRPMSLRPDEETRIRSKYVQRRSQLTTQRDGLQAQMAAEQQRITMTHQNERAALNVDEQQAQAKAAADLATIHTQYVPSYKANDDEAVKARQEAATRVTQIDQSIADQQQRIATVKWQLARLEHERAVFSRITFGAYVLRAMWPFAA